MYVPILSVMSSSNPLSNLDLTATETLLPIPAKNPAHSRATYPAPTTNVFPGFFFYQNRSSEVIQSSAPLTLDNLGLPPTAIQKYSEV